MSQKLPANDFKWAEDISEFNESFIKSYNEENDKGYFLEVDFQYPKNLHNLPNDLLFLHERIKIEKFERLAANLHDKKEDVTHITNLKQALNHRLVLEKVHRIIKFNQNAWLKPNIGMNTELREKAKTDS